MNALSQGHGNARFSEAGFSRDQYDLAIAGLGAPSGATAGRFLLRGRPAGSASIRATPRTGWRWRSGAAPAKPKPARRCPLVRSLRASGISNSSPVSRRVLAATTTVSGSAKACRRAATVGVSPATSCATNSPPTTTRPLAIPTRPWSCQRDRGDWCLPMLQRSATRGAGRRRRWQAKELDWLLSNVERRRSCDRTDPLMALVTRGRRPALFG